MLILLNVSIYISDKFMLLISNNDLPLLDVLSWRKDTFKTKLLIGVGTILLLVRFV